MLQVEFYGGGSAAPRGTTDEDQNGSANLRATRTGTHNEPKRLQLLGELSELGALLTGVYPRPETIQGKLWFKVAVSPDVQYLDTPFH